MAWLEAPCSQMRPWGQTVLPRQVLLECDDRPSGLDGPFAAPSPSRRPPFSSRGFLRGAPPGEGAVPTESTGRRLGHTAPPWGQGGPFQVRSPRPPRSSRWLTASILTVQGRRGDDLPGASRVLLQRRLPVRGDSQPGPVPQQHVPQHAGLHGGHSAVQRWVARGAEPPASSQDGCHVLPPGLPFRGIFRLLRCSAPSPKCRAPTNLRTGLGAASQVGPRGLQPSTWGP